MDAVTSFELEAQRRRETVASDRDHARVLMTAETDAVEARIVEPAITGAPSMPISGNCQPAPLARQSAG